MSKRAVSLQRAGIHLAMGLSLRMRVVVCVGGLDEFGQKVKRQSHMKIRLSISTAITIFGVVLAVGFAAVVLTGAYALKELKVGGPLYDRIKLGNDLVADILPPPEYIIEAYLEATLALREPKALADHEKKLQQLRKDYDDRKTFWTSSALDPDMKAMLVDKSDGEVQKFWKT